MAPHLPLVECPGSLLDVCTRPIIVESGIHRCRQKVWLSRIQCLLSSHHFCNFQHAVYKGSSCTTLRRLLYCLFFQHYREGREFLLLKTDQSNAYGQTDLTGLSHQCSGDPVLLWAVSQSLALYSLIRICVSTAYGMSEPYCLGGGLIQALGAQPDIVGGAPGPLVVDPAVAQQHLGEAMVRPHQVGTRVLAGAHQIAGTLIGNRGHRHRDQLPRP